MTALVRVLDPSGVCQFETDDMQVAFSKVAKLAAPSLANGTPNWHEKGWRVLPASPELEMVMRSLEDLVRLSDGCGGIPDGQLTLAAGQVPQPGPAAAPNQP